MFNDSEGKVIKTTINNYLKFQSSNPKSQKGKSKFQLSIRLNSFGKLTRYKVNHFC